MHIEWQIKPINLSIGPTLVHRGLLESRPGSLQETKLIAATLRQLSILTPSKIAAAHVLVNEIDFNGLVTHEMVDDICPLIFTNRVDVHAEVIWQILPKLDAPSVVLATGPAPTPQQKESTALISAIKQIWAEDVRTFITSTLGQQNHLQPFQRDELLVEVKPGKYEIYELAEQAQRTTRKYWRSHLNLSTSKRECTSNVACLPGWGVGGLTLNSTSSGQHDGFCIQAVKIVDEQLQLTSYARIGAFLADWMTTEWLSGHTLKRVYLCCHNVAIAQQFQHGLRNIAKSEDWFFGDFSLGFHPQLAALDFLSNKETPSLFLSISNSGSAVAAFMSPKEN